MQLLLLQSNSSSVHLQLFVLHIFRIVLPLGCSVESATLFNNQWSDEDLVLLLTGQRKRRGVPLRRPGAGAPPHPHLRRWISSSLDPVPGGSVRIRRQRPSDSFHLQCFNKRPHQMKHLNVSTFQLKLKINENQQKHVRDSGSEDAPEGLRSSDLENNAASGFREPQEAAAVI